MQPTGVGGGDGEQEPIVLTRTESLPLKRPSSRAVVPSVLGVTRSLQHLEGEPEAG